MYSAVVKRSGRKDSCPVTLIQYMVGPQWSSPLGTKGFDGWVTGTGEVVAGIWCSGRFRDFSPSISTLLNKRNQYTNTEKEKDKSCYCSKRNQKKNSRFQIEMRKHLPRKTGFPFSSSFPSSSCCRLFEGRVFSMARVFLGRGKHERLCVCVCV